MLYGTVTSEMYMEETARDERIDFLRDRMTVVENSKFSQDYLDKEKRSIASSVQVFFADGSLTKAVLAEYPLGHPRRRQEALPKLKEKFWVNLCKRFPEQHAQRIMQLTWGNRDLQNLPVDEFVAWFLPTQQD